MSEVKETTSQGSVRKGIESTLILLALIGITLAIVIPMREARTEANAEFQENVRGVDAMVQSTIDDAHDAIVVVDDAQSPVASRYANKTGTCLQYAFMVPANSIQKPATEKYGERSWLRSPSDPVAPVIENDIKGAYTYIENHPSLEPVCVSSRNQREVDPFWKHGKGSGTDLFDDGTIVGGLPYRYGAQQVTVREIDTTK